MRRKRVIRSWNSEQLWSDPRSQSTLDYSESHSHALPRFWIAAWYTDFLWVLQETFLNDYLLEKDHPQLSSQIHGMWHHLLTNWDLTFQEIAWYRKGNWDESCRIRFYLYHASKVEVEHWIILVELILTMVLLITRDFQSRKCIWESFRTLWNSKAGTEVCSKSACPHVTMHWIKEVDTTKSIDNLLTSRSILARTDFPDYDMLDAMTASALKKLLTDVHYLTRVSVEEQRAQKDDRFLRGRPIASMIHEHFRATWFYEAVQGLSDLFNIRLQNDDVQDFDVWWDHALLSATEIPTDVILEGLYKSNCRILFGFRLSWLCTTKKLPETILPDTMDKRVIQDRRLLWDFISIQWWELKTSESRAKLSREEQWPRVRKERKPRFRGKCDSVFQKETHVVSVTNLPRETVSEVRDEKDSRPLPHQIPRPRLTAREKNPQKNQATEMKALQTKGAKFRADTGIVTTRHVKFGIFLQTCWGWGDAQQKVKERWCSTWTRKIGIKTRRQILHGNMAPYKGSSRGIISKGSGSQRSRNRSQHGDPRGSSGTLFATPSFSSQPLLNLTRPSDWHERPLLFMSCCSSPWTSLCCGCVCAIRSCVCASVRCWCVCGGEWSWCVSVWCVCDVSQCVSVCRVLCLCLCLLCVVTVKFAWYSFTAQKNRYLTWNKRPQSLVVSHCQYELQHVPSPSTWNVHFPLDVQHCCHGMLVSPRFRQHHTNAKIPRTHVMLAPMLAQQTSHQGWLRAVDFAPPQMRHRHVVRDTEPICNESASERAFGKCSDIWQRIVMTKFLASTNRSKSQLSNILRRVADCGAGKKLCLRSPNGATLSSQRRSVRSMPVAVREGRCSELSRRSQASTNITSAWTPAHNLHDCEGKAVIFKELCKASEGNLEKQS